MFKFLAPKDSYVFQDKAFHHIFLAAMWRNLFFWNKLFNVKTKYLKNIEKRKNTEKEREVEQINVKRRKTKF